ncbi:MAG: DUF927 domain-containing protein [Gammaproteobacteria bacterium]|nr:DUF927 domain-containing protein [Gammaproteobacteria bacterium]
MPVQLDDSQNSLRREDVARIVYMLGNGVGRMRGSKRGSQQTATWRTVAFITGEWSVEEASPYAGIAARILTVHDPFDGAQRADVERLTDAIHAHHGVAGRAFLRWLMGRPGWEREVRARFEYWRAELAEQIEGGGLIARRRKHLALFLATAELLQQVLPWPLRESVTLTEVLLEYLVTWSRSVPERDQAREAYEHFAAWAALHRRAWLDPDATKRAEPHDSERGEFLESGCREPGRGAVLPPALQRWADESGYPPADDAAGVGGARLARAGDGKNAARRVRLFGVPVRMYEVLLEGGDDGDDGDGVPTVPTAVPTVGQAQLPGT